MAALRFVSPERGWRAGLLVVPGAWFGWAVYHFFGIAAGCVVGALVLSLAVLTMRTSLTVTGDELIDHRAVRTARVPWPEIAGFRVGRPGGLWDGYCVVAARHDGTEVDLLSTRVYSRSPSARHLEELHQTCHTLRGFSPPTARFSRPARRLSGPGVALVDTGLVDRQDCGGVLLGHGLDGHACRDLPVPGRPAASLRPSVAFTGRGW